MLMARRAVFIDRDGVINRPLLRDGKPCGPFRREELEFFPNVKEALKLLKILGFLRILVTNQPDVAYGNLSEDEWRWMQDRVEELGFDDVFICRHGRLDVCGCKKPKPGMILAAAKKWEIDLFSSYMIGDTANDIDAALAAGVRHIIMISAPYNKTVLGYNYIAFGFLHAAHLIDILEA